MAMLKRGKASQVRTTSCASETLGSGSGKRAPRSGLAARRLGDALAAGLPDKRQKKPRGRAHCRAPLPPYAPPKLSAGTIKVILISSRLPTIFSGKLRD